MNVRKCKCGRWPSIEQEGKYKWYQCKCGIESEKSLYERVALRSWNKKCPIPEGMANFSMRLDPETEMRIKEISKRVGISKTAFVIDALDVLLSKVKDYSVEEYHKKIIGD